MNATPLSRQFSRESLRTADPERLRYLMRRRGLTLERLAGVVGASALYSALFVADGASNRVALARLCVALGCRLEELTGAQKG